MATLKVGRVGLDVEITEPSGVSSWQSQAAVGRTETISGFLRSTSLAETEALRSELLEQRNRLIAVTWSVDSTMDGFYIQQGVSIGARVDENAFTGVGFHPFTVTLGRIGSEGQTELQSLITSMVITNEYDIDSTEITPFLAPPVGHVAFKANATAFPTQRTRTTADSATDLDWYDGIDPDADPTWSCPPSSYYDGAARIYVSGRLRAGFDSPNDPADFEISNGLVKITPGTTASVSNGRIEVATYDGSAWDTAISYSIYYNATTEIPAWHLTSILENTAEVCRFRLIRDANDTQSSRAHYLDITVRRGAPFASFYYSWNGGTHNIQVRRTSTEAATAITPTGASGPIGIRATSNDGDGNRYVMAAPMTHTQDLTNGRLTRATDTNMAFMIGAEIGGSGAATGDTADALILQYLGAVSEVVRAIPR